MAEKRTREIRYMEGERFSPRLREATDTGKGGRTIEGYAIVFGVMSRMLMDYWDDYREIIEPGAITEDDLKRMDIKMTLWHNRERLLARSSEGEGSLKLSVDDTGVKYEFEAPMTPDGDTAIELVKRGDLRGSSFTYWSDEASSVRYTKDAEGVLTRHVQRIDEVMEMTIASDPAYVQTNVTAREIEAGGVKMEREPNNGNGNVPGTVTDAEREAARKREKEAELKLKCEQAVNKVRELVRKRIYK